MATFEKYKIKVTRTGFKLTAPLTYGAFAKEVGVYKVYVFKNENKIFYVGITRQRVSSRLAGGYRSYNTALKLGKSLNGYSGYKLIKRLRNSEIDLWVFPLKGLRGTVEKKYKCAESIEAEIVYGIRKKTNEWPLFQNEIHFHNLSASKLQAKAILVKLIGK
jgi:hypothetical protein